MFDKTWQQVHEKPSLSPNEVHIWRVWLNQPVKETAACQLLLSPDELTRAERFYFDRDRRRYIVARGHLRNLLAHYLGKPALDIRLQYTTHGKPELAGEADVRFNVSHAQDVALIGFCRGVDLGVDVERVRPLSDMDAVAHRSFSETEYAEFLKAPVDLKPTAFFNCWTRKEAFIKAVGEGLSYPLRSFAVTLLPGEFVRFRHIQGSRAEAAQWTLRAFQPAAEYVGAFALPGNNWQTNLYSLEKTCQ